MKKAFCLSLLIHGVIFAGSFGVGNFFDTKSDLPKVIKTGLSVEILSNNYTPSVSSSRKFQTGYKNKTIIENKPRSIKKQRSSKQGKEKARNKKSSVSSKARSAAICFSGSEYKNWLLEYYSLILKHVKIKMQELNVVAGNLTVVINIQRGGTIKEFNIVSSDYGANIETRINSAMLGVKLPAFPDKMYKNNVKIKIKVVYR